MKIGSIRVFSCCKGFARPTLGPLWYFSWFYMLCMFALLGGILMYLTWFIPYRGPLIYVAWVLISIESIMYWMLCYSYPGIPDIILKRAQQIKDGMSEEEMAQ